MTAITLWSESGGVGKTTTTLHLAAALGRAGYDVLMVDLDPQPASLTDHAGYPDAKTDDARPTVVDALLGDETRLADLRIDDDHYDLIPAHESLASLESTVRAEGLSMAEFLLESALAPLEDDYDYVLVDPPATLNLLVDNALIATGNLLIPVELTRKGERSVAGVLDTVTALETQLRRARPGFELTVLGVVPNKVSGSRLNREIEAGLADDIPLLPVSIPDYNVLEAAWNAHRDIFELAEHPDHGLRPYQEQLLDAYRDLAKIVADATSHDRPEPRVEGS